jgi:cytochrome P450
VLTVSRDRRFSAERIQNVLAKASPATGHEVQAVRRFLSHWLVFVDPPGHTRLRRLMTNAFSAKSVAAMESFMRAAVDEALDQIGDAEEFDLVEAFSSPVPANIVGRLLGVRPEDVGQFRSWTSDVFRVVGVGDRDEDARRTYQGIRNLTAYFHELIAERRRAPAEDLLGALIAANEDGQTLSEEELIATCALILVAGHETSTHQIGNGVIALQRNPTELARLQAEPQLIDAAVEEILRYDGSAGGIARRATTDIELSGQVIPAGDVAVGLTQAANRDPEVYSDPDRFLIGRSDGRHIAFGQGPHVCIGAALARLELTIAIGALLARFPNLELATDDLEWVRGLAARGVHRLPVRAGARVAANRGQTR